QREAKMIVKSKTILTEEIGLNEVLEEAGIEVNETDLAEFILQTAVSPPSHIVVPGLHFERNKIREIFAEKLGYTGTENPTEMTHFVRGYVRERFLKADVGVNGCNFAVAESGTCTIVSNEGNGRMASSIPKTQLIFLGTERIVPNFKALDVMMEMLNRSAVGSKISNYFSMMTGPGRAGEADGPEETHIIIIDNGRSGILGGTFQEMLRCIRCGACMNICPVYRHISGHGYGSVYPGPMGAVLTPLFKGYDVAGDLPYASTLCGACTENCPVAIPLHELLMEHRHIMADIEKTRPKAEEAIFTAAAKMFGNSTLFDLGTKAGAIGMNLISNKEGNMPTWTQAIPVMNGWTKSKEMGTLKFKKFRDLYAEHEKNKKKEKK
ncbi:MAG: lactate utilization protein B, partial [Veillonella sp.]|nr:lactate utilization protein B [Veillonella sp.]